MGIKIPFQSSITLPVNTEMVFMFWIPIDVKGDSTDGWDTNENLTYFSNFKEPNHLQLTDWGLEMPSFNILMSGWRFLIGAFVFCVALVFFFRKQLSYSHTGMITGLLSASVLIDVIIRMQMNRLRTNPQKMPGAIFGDMLVVISHYHIILACCVFIQEATESKKCRFISICFCLAHCASFVPLQYRSGKSTWKTFELSMALLF